MTHDSGNRRPRRGEPLRSAAISAAPRGAAPHALRTLRWGAVLAATFALLAACSSTPPTRYYALESVAASQSSPPLSGAGKASTTIAVRAVSLPAAVDRPQFVVRAGDSRVNLDEFNRWAGPLRDEIARVVAGNLSAELGATVVTVSAALPAASDLVVLLDVQRFDAKTGEGVDVDVVWIVRRAVEDAPGRSGRSVVREPSGGAGYEALVAAYNRALARVSRDVAAAVRAY